MLIRPDQFDVTKLLETLLDCEPGHSSDSLGWRGRCEIILDYRHPNAKDSTRTKCVVRLGTSFLRHSCGPKQHHFWDMYGDDYWTPELALLALMHADPPYWVIQEGIGRANETV